ncbi:excinuclease ABC subunit UvrB [Anaerolineales bacterium HSG25]|nr:excinuclease ABC subunit UvrB [Anaerolineales bacterium HSG25]
MPEFKIVSPFEPTGDQPVAINKLVEGLNKNLKHQTLLGATGTGKTHTIARVIETVQKPTLIMAHNKTLAAQLYSEFKEFFPQNAVAYFVSYYDYYQPEAYQVKTDTYIEKESQINEEIDRLRLKATQYLFSRSDVIIVASVSAIYGLGSPEDYGQVAINLRQGDYRKRDKLLRQLIDIRYERNDFDLGAGKFRVRGDTLEVMPPYGEQVYRIEFFGDEIDRITEVHGITGEVLNRHVSIDLYPAKHFVTMEEKLNEAIVDIEEELEARLKELREQDKLLEVQRLEQRVNYDLEMLREVGYCSGIENYSQPLSRREPGSTPWTLMDYFPDDFLLVVDESHISVPQIRGMHAGDRSRKTTLVDYGFRLPSALDNRPLNFEEWEDHIHQAIYTTATPGPYEYDRSQKIIEQVIRPTGLLDPEVEVRPIEGQIDDLVAELNDRLERGERALITTLTKRMSEDLSDYLMELGIKVQYLHSDIDTIERVEILRDLRLGVYDVVVGINLLREGLDLPEVSLVAILDADKEGFLRSRSALVQTIGRAARHVNGKAIMYADKITDSMRYAIDETNRRRKIQKAHNKKHGITPRSIVKKIKDLTDDVAEMVEEEDPDLPLAMVAEEKATYEFEQRGDPEQTEKLIAQLETMMKAAAAGLEFEKAAKYRDQIAKLKEQMEQ